MSDTYSYEVLEPGGHARLVGNVLDRISEASANPASAVGSSRALLGDAETASWMERTTAADGAALIESICGNTVVQDGSLLPVRMEGVETNGFNRWDEQTADGYWNDNGTMTVSPTFICCKNKIPVFPGQTYYIQRPSASINVYIRGYDADDINGISLSLPGTNLLTIPDGIYFIAFSVQKSQYGTTYNNDICINISDPARNGTYEPYWSSQRTIPASTYFPDGMRSAGSVRDELTATQAITRVGSVDLGTLTWNHAASDSPFFYASLDDAANGAAGLLCKCSLYEAVGSALTGEMTRDKTVCIQYGFNRVLVRDESYQTADAATFKAAMSGVMLHYVLATPTTQPIDPPLPMSYRTGAGGTERVMVASGTTSAPPIFVTRYPLDPTDLAASIAPVDGPTAKTNHQVGDLLMLGFTLCKATQVIVTGETIAIGTNVTRTSVAAELAALSE